MTRRRKRAAELHGVKSPGLGPLRLAQLESDLRMTPEQRIRAAEQTARLWGRARGTGRRQHRIICFDRYEDYVEWKEKEQATP